MVIERKLKNMTVRVDEDMWNVFKKVTKLNNTDASKEIRKFIEKYVEENKEKLQKLF